MTELDQTADECKPCELAAEVGVTVHESGHAAHLRQPHERKP